MKKNHKDNGYLIIANGPFIPRKIIVEIAQDKSIIALDGAADRLAKIGILPHVILGDFDSIENQEVWGIKATFNELKDDDIPYPGNYGVTIVPAKNQMYTDLTKGIRYCDHAGAKSIDIICTIGDNRIDHTLGSLRTLRAYFKRDRPIRLHTSSHTLTFACFETITIQGKPDDTCGILSFPSAIYTSTGLKYNGQRFPLNFGFSESTCNQLAESKAEVNIHGEALIMHPGFYPSQRQFADYTNLKKLQLLTDECDWHLVETTVNEFIKVRQLRQKIKMMTGIKTYHDFHTSKTGLMSLNKKSNSIIYVSCNKELLLTQDPSQKILLSMKSEKYKAFRFFKLNLNKNIEEEMAKKIVKELYLQETKLKSSL